MNLVLYRSGLRFVVECYNIQGDTYIIRDLRRSRRSWCSTLLISYRRLMLDGCPVLVISLKYRWSVLSHYALCVSCLAALEISESIVIHKVQVDLKRYLG